MPDAGPPTREGFFYVLPPQHLPAYIRTMELRDALREIETGRLFSLQWVACDLTRNKGGQIRQLDGLRLIIREGGEGAPRRPMQYQYENSCQYIKLWHGESGRYYTVYKTLMLRMDGQQIQL